MSNEEYRRSRRRRVAERGEGVAPMTEQPGGPLGNVSESGLLLLANAAMHDDCLYQLRFTLSDRMGHRSVFEVGAHLLWHNGQAPPGQAWTGFRFLSLEDSQLERLREWIDAPDATYV